MKQSSSFFDLYMVIKGSTVSRSNQFANSLSAISVNVKSATMVALRLFDLYGMNVILYIIK